MLTPAEHSLVLEAREILGRYLNQNPVISSWQVLNDYCALSVHGPVESFHVLYLDQKNQLIEDVKFATGTVGHVPVYPREVVKRALLLNASALILVHNHPSGQTTPSEADLKMTKEVKKACQALGLTLHDHIITGGPNTYSFRSNGDLK